MAGDRTRRYAACLLAAVLAVVEIPAVRPAAAASAAAVPEESGEVTRVVDGDTVDVDLDGRRERVRLLGVDAPEMGHHERPADYFAREATAFVRRLADHRRIALRGDPGHENRDDYGRLLRYLILPDGRCLNAELLRQGYAHALTRYPFSRMKEFRRLEREARDAGRGLWAAH